MLPYRSHLLLWISLLCLCASETISTSLISTSLSAAQLDGETEERGLRQLIRETQDSIRSERWLEAIERFDSAWEMACEKDDPLMSVTGADVRQLAPGQTEQLAGGKAQLESLYQTAPEKFRTEFQRQYAQVAEGRINGVLQSGDLSELRRLCLRYTFSAAAERGYRILAKVSVDRGDFQEAALLLGRLDRMASAKVADENLPLDEGRREQTLQLALSYKKADLRSDAVDVARRLIGQPELLINGQTLQVPQDPAQLADWLDQLGRMSLETPTTFQWLQPGGSYRRDAFQSRTPAKLTTTWSTSLYQVNDVLYSEQYNDLLSTFQTQIEKQYRRMLATNSVLIPTAHPLLVGDLAIIRTPFGLRALRASTGELVWEVTRPDTEIRAGMDRLTTPPDSAPPRGSLGYLQFIEPWRLLMSQGIRTNAASQMSVSGKTLFVVDECTAATWNEEFGFGFGDDSTLSISSNFIRAYDVETGLFKWEIGGKTQSNSLPAGRGNLLSGFYFLGAPLILGSRTYVLAESGEGIFLIQILEPTRESRNQNPSIARSQILTVPQFKLPQHPVRKHAGLMPSFAQGLLICPTCDERIVAVAAEDHSLRWIFRYGANIRRQDLGGDAPILFGGRDFYDTSRVDTDSRWIDSYVRIAGERVLVTPRDSDQVFCLDLKTGQELWKSARSGYHAIAAVTADSVVLVGNQRVSSLSLIDGKVNWATQIPEGIVCGTAACNGRLLQVPVSEPAILTLDVATGQLLVRQPLTPGTVPGNLLATPGGLLMQSLTSVTCSVRGTGDLNLADQGTELLLEGRLSEAVTLLDEAVVQNPNDIELRLLLIDVLFRAMQSDFPRYRSYLPRARELTQANANQVDIAPVLHSLLGMNPSDIPVAAKILQGNAGRYLDALMELEAQEIRSSGDRTTEQLVASLSVILKELPEAESQRTGSGFLKRNRAAVLVASIRESILTLSAQDRLQLTNQLIPVAQQIVSTLPTEQMQVQFCMDVINAGLPRVALPLVSNGGTGRLKPHAALLQELALLQMLKLNDETRQSTDTLLELWKQTEHADSISTFVNDIGRPSLADSQLRFQISDETIRSSVADDWKSGGPLFPGGTPPSVWTGTPTVTESDDRSMLPPQKVGGTVPDLLIPIYGPPGVYRDWSFARSSTSDSLIAFDADGVIRWKLKSVSVPNPSRYGFAASSYLVVSGHLLILSENDMLTAIDASRATPEREPLVMWNDFTARLAPDMDASDYRDFVPTPDRLTQYYPYPSGFYPCGLIRAGAVPIISGRRLTVLSAMTGTEMWHLDGIARDCVTLCSGDNVLLLSEQSRQIEVRSLLDGSLVSVSRLPEWWGEAIGNVASSVKDLDLESGTDILWRISLHGQSCVLFRLTEGRSTLECRDLLTDKVTWSVALPQEAVFSNPIDDVVAVLSEGKNLKLVQLDTGKILADLNVSAVVEPRDLVLRKTQGQYVVLPESVDDPSFDYAPVQYAMHVYGRMYAIDAETFQLSWDKPLDHRHIRVMIPERGAMLPNAPVLVLLQRVGKRTEGSPIPKVRYGVRLVDVHTGEDLHKDDDVGITLNEHWLKLDAAEKTLILSFERRFLTLDYSEK